MSKDNFMNGIFTKPIGEQIDELAELKKGGIKMGELHRLQKNIEEFLADKKGKIIRDILEELICDLASGCCDCGWGEDIYEMIIGKDNFETIMEKAVKKLEGV